MCVSDPAPPSPPGAEVGLRFPGARARARLPPRHASPPHRQVVVGTHSSQLALLTLTRPGKLVLELWMHGFAYSYFPDMAATAGHVHAAYVATAEETLKGAFSAEQARDLESIRQANASLHALMLATSQCYGDWRPACHAVVHCRNIRVNVTRLLELIDEGLSRL